MKSGSISIGLTLRRLRPDLVRGDSNLNMEIGLITPPVGLNLYVINSIVKDVNLKTVLWGAFPFMLCLVLGILLLTLIPGIASWLPDYLMGPVQ